MVSALSWSADHSPVDSNPLLHSGLRGGMITEGVMNVDTGTKSLWPDRFCLCVQAISYTYGKHVLCCRQAEPCNIHDHKPECSALNTLWRREVLLQTNMQTSKSLFPVRHIKKKKTYIPYHHHQLFMVPRAIISLQVVFYHQNNCTDEIK